jgi:hypothetical protein
MIKKIFLVGFFLFFIAGPVAALPTDAISVITNSTAMGTTTLLTSNTTTTIISFYTNHAFNGETDVLSCGNTALLSYNVSVGNYQSFPVLEFFKTCNTDIKYKNGSANDDTIVLNYLPYDIYNQTQTSTSTTELPANYELISTGTNSFYLDKSFSYSDFFVVFFLVVITAFAIFDFIQRFIYKIKVNFRH